MSWHRPKIYTFHRKGGSIKHAFYKEACFLINNPDYSDITNYGRGDERLTGVAAVVVETPEVEPVVKKAAPASRRSAAKIMERIDAANAA